MPVVVPAIPFVEPPSVALGMPSAPRLIPDFAGEGEPDQVENAMREDDLDKELVDILGDIDEDTLSNSPIQHSLSNFGTQQHPPYFSTLNLEAINQQLDVDPTFGGQGLHDGTAPTEFQIGQSFQSKEEAVLSVKDYSIHCEVEYRLDYHVICARIFPLVRADAAVTIKVLWQATKEIYGFRPTYRKSTMERTITLLEASPVRVVDQVDPSTVYFRSIFWTFPPSVEAFQHCKLLVNIDGTHLYGKSGRTLLLASAQDENSNILPIAFALVEGKNAESWSFFSYQLATICDSIRGYSGDL
ncbi:uncharacterized protein LOC107632931 [Arachis ipaensis]|uniref:uncharacterized protein LOC107632931 n=1 Tax=Arachis ipaensis TaxID=130454 RepID=UPI0007AF68C2|nr:uncharacterized protein LOC107632931 [Arachis ipaensis]